MSIRPLILSATAVVVCAAAGGCASGPKPTDELTKAHTVVEQADKGNAQRYAAADLQRAHDELSEAERADVQKRHDEARYLAQRAEADADVAVARGNSSEAQKAAQEVKDSSRTLQQESERSSGLGPQASSPPVTNPQ
jgi:aspartokinase